jgi:hypothetical protein
MQTFSWIFIYAFALPIFFIMVYVLYKFMDFKLKTDQESIGPIFNTSDNVVGLDPEELAKRKKHQLEGMKHLTETIAKVPVKMVNGKFEPMSGDELKAEFARRKVEEDAKLKAAESNNLIQLTLPDGSEAK